MNVPPSIALVVSRGLATMGELSTVIDLEELHDLVEIATVDRHNQALVDREADRRRRG